MSHFKANTPLDDPRQEAAIFALLKKRTKKAAAKSVGVDRRTIDRWLADPDFMARYRQIRRFVFDDALFVLEKSAEKAAWLLVDECDASRQSSIKRTPLNINAAKAVLDRAFKAQGVIAVEQELASLRALMDELQALPVPVAAAPAPSVEAIRMAENEQAEAFRLRVAWMTKAGMDGDAIESSLRTNRPQTVEEERYLFELVEKMAAFEEAHSPENLRKFFAGEGEAENVPG